MTELGKQLLRDKDHAVEGLKMLDLGAAGGDPEAHRALFQFHSSGTAPNMSKALVSSSSCFPVAASQIRTVSSALPDTTRLPSWENATEVTPRL